MAIKFPSFKKTCVISCPIGTHSGYGERSRDLVRQIIKNLPDHQVSILPQVWGATPMTEFPVDLESHVIDQLTSKPDIWIQITIPSEFNPIGNFNIGITAGLESTPVPADWINGVNRMNLVLTSSEFAKRIILESQWKFTDQNGMEQQLKATTPVEVLFEGLDFSKYPTPNSGKTEVVEVPHIKHIPEKQLFLFVGHWLPGPQGADRKDVGNMIEVFLRTFKDKKNAPGLLLKASGGTYSPYDRESIFDRIQKIKRRVGGNNLPNIYLLHGNLTTEQMNALYKHPKVLAHTTITHGEGFGRPVLEAAMSGKPMIISPAGGYSEFIPNELVCYTPGQMMKVHQAAVNEWIHPESVWFQANLTEFGNTLKAVHDNPKPFQQQARKLPTHLLKLGISLDDMGIRFKQILDSASLPKALPQLPKIKL